MVATSLVKSLTSMTPAERRVFGGPGPSAQGVGQQMWFSTPFTRKAHRAGSCDPNITDPVSSTCRLVISPRYALDADPSDQGPLLLCPIVVGAKGVANVRFHGGDLVS